MEAEDPKHKDILEKRKQDVSAFAQYSSLGFQMFVIIGIFTFIGYKIDENQHTDAPLYTAFLSLAGVFISLYLIIRSVKKTKA